MTVADINVIPDYSDHSAEWPEGALFNAGLALLMADQASKAIAKGDLEVAERAIRRAEPLLTFVPPSMLPDTTVPAEASNGE